jgi:hypothetical protein
MLQKASFAQLRADLNTQAQTRVAKFLQSRAKQLNSRVLSAIAVRVSDDPFKKVKKMIKDLIVRLMEEANEEAVRSLMAAVRSRHRGLPHLAAGGASVYTMP